MDNVVRVDFGSRRKAAPTTDVTGSRQGQVVRLRRKRAPRRSRRVVINIAQLEQLFGAVGRYAGWTDALFRTEETGESVWVRVPYCEPDVLLGPDEISRHADQATDALLAATGVLGKSEALRLLRRSRAASRAFLDPR